MYTILRKILLKECVLERGIQKHFDLIKISAV